jgi:hypothetical protein
MSACVLYVSVNKTFRRWLTMSELEPWVARAWALTVARAMTCDRVVAVFEGEPIGAWRLRGAFPTDETWSTTGGPRPRIGLSLGELLPVLPEYRDVPALRRGSATRVIEGLAPLGPERDESLAAIGDEDAETAI